VPPSSWSRPHTPPTTARPGIDARGERDQAKESFRTARDLTLPPLCGGGPHRPEALEDGR